jgi:hypothetical protein
MFVPPRCGCPVQARLGGRQTSRRVAALGFTDVRSALMRVPHPSSGGWPALGFTDVRSALMRVPHPSSAWVGGKETPPSSQKEPRTRVTLPQCPGDYTGFITPSNWRVARPRSYGCSFRLDEGAPSKLRLGGRQRNPTAITVNKREPVLLSRNALGTTPVPKERATGGWPALGFTDVRSALMRVPHPSSAWVGGKETPPSSQK